MQNEKKYMTRPNLGESQKEHQPETWGGLGAVPHINHHLGWIRSCEVVIIHPDRMEATPTENTRSFSTKSSPMAAFLIHVSASGFPARDWPVRLKTQLPKAHFGSVGQKDVLMNSVPWRSERVKWTSGLALPFSAVEKASSQNDLHLAMVRPHRNPRFNSLRIDDLIAGWPRPTKS